MGPVKDVAQRYLGSGKKPAVYLLDFACFDHPMSWLRDKKQMVEHGRAIGIPEETIMKQVEIYESGALGIGDRTAYAPGTLMQPPQNNIAACRVESEAILFDVTEKALLAAGVSPKEVDYVITTCTAFAPMPSLSAMVMHKFQMRNSCQNYSLAGMGCAGGVAALALAKDLLTANPNKVVLLLAHENITIGSYYGTDIQFMVSNTLFRSGGVGVVLSNRAQDRRRAKYQLLHTIRVNTSADDAAYKSIKSIDTDLNSYGVFLDTPVIKVAAAKAIAINLRRLGPLVLPLSELAKAARVKDPAYVPDFSKAFQHVAIHPGARFVIEKIRKTLSFGEKAAHPSHATIHRFGNTSGSSTYYILAHLESRVGVKKGDKVLQLGMGSGFKCCSAVWKALRPIHTQHPCWEVRDYQPELDPAEVAATKPSNKDGGKPGAGKGANLEKKSIDLTVLSEPLGAHKHVEHVEPVHAEEHVPLGGDQHVHAQEHVPLGGDQHVHAQEHVPLGGDQRAREHVSLGGDRHVHAHEHVPLGGDQLAREHVPLGGDQHLELSKAELT